MVSLRQGHAYFLEGVLWYADVASVAVAGPSALGLNEPSRVSGSRSCGGGTYSE